MASQASSNFPLTCKRKELSDEERKEIVSQLLGMHSSRGLPYGAISRIAKKFQITRVLASRLWATAKLSRAHGQLIHEEILSKKGERGRKPKWDVEAMVAETKTIPLKKRQTQIALALALGVPNSTVHHLKIKKQLFKRHKSSLQPALNDDHKIMRIDYALAQRDNNKKTYRNMYDRVHIDEKWFFMTQDGECYILAHDEEPPKRAVRHKSYISKVMFICATARPRKVNGVWWDGKIGIWPVGHYEPAQRSSSRRPKGAPVWKDETIDRDKYRELMIDFVLPAILAKFPTVYLKRHGVFIQQDGARSHIDEMDPEWLEAVEATGCKITLYTQPAQSPDLNINDLAFFRAIQSLYYKECPEDEKQLIDAVLKAFDEYDHMKLNRMWLTLMTICNQILKHDGDNHFKIPHMNKDRLEKEDRLPKVLIVDGESAAKFDPTQPTV